MSTPETIHIDAINESPATQLLDRQFPLRSGTHNYVSTYLVYFEHLLAIKTDGSTTCLVTPSQFQYADGSLDGPNAIVLNDGYTQVQIRMRHCRNANNTLHPCIDEVGIKTTLRAC